MLPDFKERKFSTFAALYSFRDVAQPGSASRWGGRVAVKMMQ